MRTHLKTILLGASLAAGSLCAQSELSNPTINQWEDPTFVKEFLGEYGFLAGYEPKISEEEKDALRALIDLIKVSPKAAIEQLEPQIKASTSAAFDFILANLYFQDGNLAKAEQFYNSAIKKHPDFRRAYKNLGLVLVQKGDFQGAIPIISKAMDLGEVDGRSYGLLGYAYLTGGRYYAADAAYRQAILMQPDVKDWKIGLARCLMETERYDVAIALFDTLLKDEPDNTDYWLLQSNAYIGKGEPLTAAKNLEVVRRMGKAEISTLTLLGDIYMNNESPDLALDAYTQAAELAGEDDVKALIRAASILTRSSSHEQAKRMITKVRSKMGSELNEEQDLELLTMSAKIARAEGDTATAIATLTKIVERDALNGEAIIELANNYADEGKLPEAYHRYEQAAKIDAHERDALVAHAQTLVRNAEYTKALPLLQRALKIKFDGNLQDYLNRVERAAKG
ncbi:tetratricopeptide repeat protein [Coraliomargarita akajimensis]|uniref:TPR repeat-containing protein n=1 Tax=Coraliomargarita akajimensis (strain DSM 45221 / IAM 15411 / JCM 23193 / KCTC 12865 / 04OKA010-24) TaxID=583355 RepID=D5EMP3_CORAD|nr:tetratricopeptide repeat protein [Coraliomargarita akajimensis]ADE55283.1 TPR repeat-containing protein [Coraliomargarita akajimensis DSM 45221]